MHVSNAREWEICYSLGTSVGDVTRMIVANIVRFSLYFVILNIRTSIFDIEATNSCSILFYCDTHLQDFRLV